MPVVEPRIYTAYKLIVCQDMIYTRALKNIMELPQIMRCVLNSSSTVILKDKTRLLVPQIALQSVCGQKSKITRSRKSVAAFQLRQGAPLGCAVTLRGATLYFFLDQYITLVSPFQRPWKIVARHDMGTTKNFSHGGNSFTVFPPLQPHWLTFAGAGGFNCTFCASSPGYKELTLLLTALQFPIESN